HVDAGVCQDGERRTTDRVDRAGAACVVEVRTDVEHAELGIANELRAPLFHNGVVANHGTDVPQVHALPMAEERRGYCHTIALQQETSVPSKAVRGRSPCRWVDARRASVRRSTDGLGLAEFA